MCAGAGYCRRRPRRLAPSLSLEFNRHTGVTHSGSTKLALGGGTTTHSPAAVGARTTTAQAGCRTQRSRSSRGRLPACIADSGRSPVLGPAPWEAADPATGQSGETARRAAGTTSRIHHLAPSDGIGPGCTVMPRSGSSASAAEWLVSVMRGPGLQPGRLSDASLPSYRVWPGLRSCGRGARCAGGGFRGRVCGGAGSAGRCHGVCSATSAASSRSGLTCRW